MIDVFAYHGIGNQMADESAKGAAGKPSHASPRQSLIPPKCTPSFELLFRPSFELIGLVRCFVADFYARLIPDPGVANRLALATHELLENACKYSTDGEAALFVECDPQSRTVTVRTANRATPERIEVLRSAFAEIGGALNADALYVEAVRRTAARATGSGGLGLARIWAEGDMRLQLVVNADRVEIHAVGNIEVP
jgi:hypothetical protein